MPWLKDRYKDDIVPAMQKEFSYSNVNQVPRLSKIVVNVGRPAAGDHPRQKINCDISIA
jgi:large subunit ribosomal protein L5